ncbi:hypothetical protein ID866_9541, partial [Astraeus odoratus]
MWGVAPSLAGTRPPRARSAEHTLPAAASTRLFATEVASSGPGDAVEPATRPKKAHPNLHTAIILNRSPLLTRTPSPFERAFYAYQARIHRALHNPFPYDFYFKQGSPLETRFNIEERRRERKAFGAPFGTVKPEDRDEATELMEMALRDEVDES